MLEKLPKVVEETRAPATDEKCVIEGRLGGIIEKTSHMESQREDSSNNELRAAAIASAIAIPETETVPAYHPSLEAEPPAEPKKHRRIIPFKRGGGRFHALKRIGQNSVKESDRRRLRSVLRERQSGKESHKKTGDLTKRQSLWENLKPELICNKQGMTWIIAVSFGDRSTPLSNLEIKQGGESLTHFKGSDVPFWRLRDLESPLQLANADGTVLREFPLTSERDGWLFKLTGPDERGFLVDDIQRGSYVLFVPAGWVLKDATNDQLLNQEHSFDQRYTAYFLYLSKDDLPFSATFLKEDGLLFCLTSKEQGFSLEGNVLEDSNRDFGPLFIGEPPRLKPPPWGWNNVKTIVIGQEGRGKRRWKTEICLTENYPKSQTGAPIETELDLHEIQPEPVISKDTLTLPVKDKESGWFFVRIYDHSDSLLESLDFRYVSGLKKLNIIYPDPSSSRANLQISASDKPFLVEHLAKDPRLARLEFFHDSFTKIILKSPAAHPQLSVESQSDRTIVTIPDDPDWDETVWLIRSGKGTPVRASFRINRIWWAVSEGLPEHWDNEPQPLTSGDFEPTSRKAFWLRIPDALKGARFKFLFVTAGNATSSAGQVKVPGEMDVPLYPLLRGKPLVHLRELGDLLRQAVSKIHEQDSWKKSSKRSKPHLDWPTLHDLQIHLQTTSGLDFGPIGIVRTKFRCAFSGCEYKTEKPHELLEHFSREHLDNMVVPLGYNAEIYSRFYNANNSLPKTIYKCSCCDEYVRADKVHLYGTSAIGVHFREKHPGKSPSFRIVNDPEEIKRFVIPDLPRVYKCRHCQQVFEEKDLQKNKGRLIVDHYLVEHRPMAYTLE